MMAGQSWTTEAQASPVDRLRGPSPSRQLIVGPDMATCDRLRVGPAALPVLGVAVYSPAARISGSPFSNHIPPAELSGQAATVTYFCAAGQSAYWHEVDHWVDRRFSTFLTTVATFALSVKASARIARLASPKPCPAEHMRSERGLSRVDWFREANGCNRRVGKRR